MLDIKVYGHLVVDYLNTSISDPSPSFLSFVMITGKGADPIIFQFSSEPLSV